jgi:hypothetical protein
MQLAPKLEQAKDAIQERILVIGAQSTSFKNTFLIAILCLLVGIAVGIRMDFSGFERFKRKAELIQERQRAMNRVLVRELERLREENDAARRERERADSDFEDAVNQPGPEHCLVPTADLNPIIVEAGK